MKNSSVLSLFLSFSISLFFLLPAYTQVSGNVAYDRSYKRQRPESASHRLLISDSTLLIEAKVLLNAMADEYVVVFGLAEEGASVKECNEKMKQRTTRFLSEIKKMGIGEQFVYVDFITQNRVYDYEMNGDIAEEKLSGFELKKNISIHITKKELIERLITAAAEFEIYDLIRVDYINTDLMAVKKRLFEEAMKVINAKKEMYLSGVNMKLLPQNQIYYENFLSYAPSNAYDSYEAHESGSVRTGYRSNTATIRQRKMKTFYFKPLDTSSFDKVINPVVIEPVIQYGYTLQIRFELDKS